jgi:predicted nuclease with RNAse H fold
VVLLFVVPIIHYLTMLLPDTIFVGVDPTSSQNSFTYAALDKGLNLLALGDGDLGEVAAFVAGHRSAVVAVNSPSGVNRGFGREKKELFKSTKSRSSGFRLAELELREHGITVSGTPATIAACSAWVQAGFSLYRKLEKMGFSKYPADGSTYQLLETHPHACYCAIAGDIPMPKPSLEGKIQRQLLLYEKGVRLKDPMDFFEEITRHKMLKGIWPLELLYQPEQLDALVAAYTAWLAIHKPESITTVGNPKEGVIVLPVEHLKEKY